MPNWCFNHLTITGEPEQMNLFKNHLRLNLDEEPELTFAAFVPADTIEEANQKWGTKWDLHPPEPPSIDTDDQLFYAFETAWCPPGQLIAKLGSDFQELEFRLAYFEPGNQFAGLTTIHGDEHSEFVFQDEAYTAFIAEEFDFVEPDEEEEY